ncbi:hypothetical protein AGMMS49940_14500 [Spirochaetia bacterium]|nr:hypothetical protein AGMMS49940_14500 [Spirochaetia bacterium]
MVILVFIGSLSKRFKGWIFKDIYSRLDKIENNDLRHIDLSQQRSTKIKDLILDVLAGITQKEEIADRRARIEIWYSQKSL